MIRLTTTFLLLFLTTIVFGQMPKEGVLTGKVLDSHTNSPIEYANVALFSMRDSSLVTGAVTTQDGIFRLENLPYGRFYLSIKFMGYNSKKVEAVKITPKNKTNNLGNIVIEPDNKQIEGVEVVADKAPILYKIDKKVISPSQFPTAAGGSAIDVLEQTPSVTVDIEGNVSLRGSSNFTVLIDGRPSPFDSSEALQQVPTSSIEDIEIITNPSAKYNPEGTAGIINIITKKSKLAGINGIVNTTIGNHENYGVDFLVNYKTKKFNLFTGANYNDRNFPGERTIESRTLFDGVENYVRSEGDGSFNRTTKSWKFGFDYFLSPKTTFSTSVTTGSRSMKRADELNYKEWTIPASETNEYIGGSEFGRSGDFVKANAALIHNFQKEGHKLELDAQFSTDTQDESSISTQEQNNVINNGQQTVGVEEDDEWRLKLDYSLPINETTKLEAGWQSRLEKEDGDNVYSLYENDGWKVNDQFSYKTESKSNVHAAYSTFSTEFGKFGIQAGLRAELTDRSIKNVDNNQSFDLNRWDFFPTLHTSLQVNKTLQLMGSYTRRINRPRSHYLEPTERYIDAYNVRAGNPNLEPEYIDSYEIGISQRIKKSFISAEVYYRITDNTIERTRRSISPTLTYNTFQNVGKDYALGAELMFSSQVNKVWRMQLSGNLYDYKVEGVLYDKPFERTSFNWNARLGNTFMVSPTLRFQLDGMYISKSATAQGSRDPFYMINTAIRKDFMDRKLTATLQVRDLFGTMKHHMTTETPTYNSVMDFKRGGQMIQLSLSYRINNFKLKKSDRRGGADMGSDELY
ncbi:TonB-dependent receptor [Prolixibacteraceae bacterium JC049]|nr:TonB-dependent receptor [Prolixibacteraceae bacterium JC049]